SPASPGDAPRRVDSLVAAEPLLARFHLRHPARRVAGKVDGPRGPEDASTVEERVADLLLRLRGVPRDEDTHASPERARQADLPAATSAATSSRSASARRPSGAAAIASSAALPTMTPSAMPRRAATCSGRLIPNPTATGSAVCRRTRPTKSRTSAPRAVRAPVTPVSETQ